jgi:hypothetical protein
MNWPSILDWLKGHQDVISLATLASLIIACWQIYAARKQTKNLEQIQESISTRYIGDLTRYYPEVISLIEDARKTVVIFCDYPAYGCFTNSRYWRAYYNTLMEKQEKGKVRISLTCPKLPVRHDNDETEYFPNVTEEIWSEWKTDNRHNLKMFLLNTPDKQQNISHSNVEKLIDNLSRDRFFEMLLLADKWMLKNCFDEEDEQFIESSPPIDFWVVDGMSAIFALTNYKEGMSQYGFKTTDQKLIDALLKTKDYYLSSGGSRTT